jgi:hypothetical protein
VSTAAANSREPSHILKESEKATQPSGNVTRFSRDGNFNFYIYANRILARHSLSEQQEKMKKIASN